MLKTYIIILKHAYFEINFKKHELECLRNKNSSVWISRIFLFLLKRLIVDFGKNRSVFEGFFAPSRKIF